MKTNKPSARRLKGVYTLNPTAMIMKQGSQKSRSAVSEPKTKTNKAVKARGKK